MIILTSLSSVSLEYEIPAKLTRHSVGFKIYEIQAKCWNYIENCHILRLHN